MEKASAAANTPAPLKVRVRANGLPTGAMRTADSVEEAIGTISVNVPTGLSATYSAGSASDLNFDEEDEVVITLMPGSEDPNWKDEKIVLKLTSNDDSIAPGPGTFTVTVDDDEVAPTAKFKRTSVKITEESTTMVDVMVVKSTSTGVIPPGVSAHDSEIMLSVSPAKAVTTDATCPTGEMAGSKALRIGGAGTLSDMEMLTLGTVATISSTPQTLTFEACGDMSGFQDTEVMLAFDSKSLMHATAGDVMAGARLAITIESDEKTPTVSFVPTNIAIPEGGSTRVVLTSDGPHGAEVMMVKLSVKGDAMISLMQAGEALEEEDGYVMVDLGDSANATLTAQSHSDPDLMDGDTKSKTWTIMEADGAEIGDDYWLTVTVNGSTAVPALPLVGQLLLALFLMAGGTRLYRRRQG